MLIRHFSPPEYVLVRAEKDGKRLALVAPVPKFLFIYKYMTVSIINGAEHDLLVSSSYP